jgi:hypothetical protein
VVRQLGVECSLQYRLGELLDEAVPPKNLLGSTKLQQEFIDDVLVDAQGVTPALCRVAWIKSHTKI